MNHDIASKLAATAIALVINGIILGGVILLFDSRAEAAATCAHIQSDATRSPAVIV